MNLPFILSTDASGTALGSFWVRKTVKGKKMVVSYGGRSLRPEERKYTVSELECLAVVEGIKANHEYLEHSKFGIHRSSGSKMALLYRRPAVSGR